MRLDLHVHTVASDGACTASEIVQGAVQGRLDAIAISDHDTTASVGPATEAARGQNLQVIPAAELSSTHGDRELHILGYFIDRESAALREYEARALSLRSERMQAMIDRLRSEGMAIDMKAVLEAAGPHRHMLARPHLARAIIKAGHATSMNDAFDRHIGDERPAFVPTRLQRPDEAVAVILASGGIPVWAHPPADLVEGLVRPMIDAGLRGLEVFRPTASARRVQRLLSIARGGGLLVSGGSDWHDPERNDPIGTFFVTADEVADLLEEGGM